MSDWIQRLFNWPVITALIVLGTTGACTRSAPGGEYNNSNGNLNNNSNSNEVGVCGDGVVNPGESCDGSDLQGQDCVSQGFTAGPLACTAACTLDTTNCSLCGNGIADGTSPEELRYEVCDGEDLRGQDCASLSLGEGELGCTATCQWDVQYCTSPPVVHVDCDPTITIRDGLSWSTALATVQEGIDTAHTLGPGAEVWVAACTYYIYQISRDDTVQLRGGVAVYGGFAGTETIRSQRDWTAHETILDGTDGASENVRSVVTGSDNAELNGFIITGGGSANSGNGGGMNNGGVSPVVANCTFIGNQAYNGGAMFNSYSSPVVTNCTFTGNSANAGGAMFNAVESPVVTNCKFLGNSATYGGGMHNSGSDAVVTNSLFAGNSATFGGGLMNSGCSPQIVNCTVSGNSATRGGGMNNHSSEVVVTNSIVWGNTANFNPVIRDINSSPVVSFCDIEGGYPGTSNISQAPQFVGGGDYHLEAGSPCIDRGDDLSAPATDLEGFSRVDVTGVGTSGTLSDIGAYEYQP